ncbi:MAG TPA: bifunctional [glutamine synthetase] adenylyltransferase/[glutamine synthetase]-adenylyl-L-tyrosine phosphorylase [Alphaproteobacteria bacterium]|nr:bifunctional [glutamine synthetase] adenylyltransferase/[glutamine synthetase]-adenylyl-L-tyrosine phosphorylase [Alphaproteobacteria bacterium]
MPGKSPPKSSQKAGNPAGRAGKPRKGGGSSTPHAGRKQKTGGTDATTASLLRHSPYLSALCEKWPYLLGAAPETAEPAIYEELAAACDAAPRDEVMAALRHAKKKIALLTALCDLRGIWDDVRVMRALSDFADIAVQKCAECLLRAAHDAGTLRLPKTKTPQKDCGVIVIALGKWGARELNYSSDIDLMVLFDAARTPMKDKDAAQNFFIRFTRDMAQMLEQATEDGYVFRCDLRLRPDPGAMPLAVSIGTAEIYYGSLGQNWERAAMTKARTVAGDTRLADDFARLMNAWIWRRNLDFAAIQDIHSIKRQINAKQSAGRVKARSGDNPYLGVNVKLGHGGIREIEFYAQTQQLIFGGRDVRLREPTTLGALAALAATGHITDDDARVLSEAYLFLRHIEHRLQMIDDRQTHSLPQQPDDFLIAAHFSGYADSGDLINALARHMGAVQKRYAALFVESQNLGESDGNLVFTGVEDDPDTLDTLRRMGFAAPEKVTAAIRGWHHGRYRAVRSERARQILTELTPQLLATLAATAQGDEAFLRFDRFLEKLPSGIPIFTMFAHHPQLLPIVADIMGTSPALAEWLGTHPQVLDGVISRDFFGRLPDTAWLEKELAHRLGAARDYQDILDITRRWAREKRFHAGIHILRRLSPLRDCAGYLSDIAEASLSQLTPHVCAEFEKAHGRMKGGDFVLLAMGSFAARRMFTDSDLDLVALYDVPASTAASSGAKPLPPSLYYIRLTQRLITAITAPTSESILYQVDARLRPAGNDGPLAASIDGFIEYQSKNAWTWEHMSLIRHRVIFGSDKARRKIAAGIAPILTKPRDAGALRKDILDMQVRVGREFAARGKWDLKYRSGGLMDQLFAVQYLQLLHAAQTPQALAPDISDALAALRRARKIDAGRADILQKSVEATLSAQMFLRLSAALPFRPEDASAGLKQKLPEFLGMQAPKGKKPDFKAAITAFQKELDAADKICRDILCGKKTKEKKRR